MVDDTLKILKCNKYLKKLFSFPPKNYTPTNLTPQAINSSEQPIPLRTAVRRNTPNGSKIQRFMDGGQLTAGGCSCETGSIIRDNAVHRELLNDNLCNSLTIVL